MFSYAQKSVQMIMIIESCSAEHGGLVSWTGDWLAEEGCGKA
jgi:hypothetical protein